MRIRRLYAIPALTAAAFAFAWWARLTMGRLWSGYVSRTADHRIVDNGPFAIVRHPIYSAIIFAACQEATKAARRPMSNISQFDSGFSQKPTGWVSSSGMTIALLTSSFP